MVVYLGWDRPVAEQMTIVKPFLVDLDTMNPSVQVYFFEIIWRLVQYFVDFNAMHFSILNFLQTEHSVQSYVYRFFLLFYFF